MNKHFCFYCMSPVNEDGSCPVCGLTAGAYQPAPHHIPPGTILMNRYFLGRVLKQGMFDITYIAIDIHSFQKVVIKEYFPEQFCRRGNDSFCITCVPEQEDAIKHGYFSFLEEAQILSTLGKMQGIITTYECFEANGSAFWVMEYPEGKSLNQIISIHGKFLPDEILLKLFPLMNSLAKLHKKNIIHCDICPDNIIWMQDGSLSLIGFGCIRDQNISRELHVPVVPRHGFAPVEMYTMHDHKGPWSDVYGLCATIYYSLTSVMPQTVLDRILDDELISPSKLGIHLPIELESILMQGLNLERRRRQKNMEILMWQYIDALDSYSSLDSDSVIIP